MTIQIFNRTTEFVTVNVVRNERVARVQVGIFTLEVTENDHWGPAVARIWIGSPACCCHEVGICVSANLRCETVEDAVAWLRDRAHVISREMLGMAIPLHCELKTADDVLGDVARELGRL